LSHVWNYHIDDGNRYGKRDDGLTCGLTQSNTSTAQDRNSPLAIDERYDRSLDLGAGGDQAWEMEVPEGLYTVFVVAGDPEATDAHYRVKVEGKMSIDKSPNPAYPWVAGKGKVLVTDGKLTVMGAPGARNNRICYEKFVCLIV